MANNNKCHNALFDVKLSDEEMGLMSKINESYGAIDIAFANNFKSQDAISSLFHVISEFNKYYGNNPDPAKSNFYLIS